MKMRDYAILASVAHEPKSGYDLTKWFDRIASHFCSAGYGSIYPALSRFEEEGLVVHEVVPSDQGPVRKVYSITERGKEVLLGWSREPAAESDIRDEQLVKALSYGMLPRKRALELLDEARGRHEARLGYYEELGRNLDRRLWEGEISGEAHLGSLLVLRRGVGFEEEYIRWCEESKALISGFADRRLDGTREETVRG